MSGRQITLQENITEVEIVRFKQLCRYHDWKYEYSDDYKVYKRGQNEYNKIAKLLKENEDDPRYERIFNYYQNK